MQPRKENRGGAREGAGRPQTQEQLPVMGSQDPPVMPDDLGPRAQELWKLAVESLPHVLRAVDGPILRMCCELYQQSFDVKNDPKLYITTVSKFEVIAAKLGLSPHSRRTIKPAAEEKEEETDPLRVWREQA